MIDFAKAVLVALLSFSVSMITYRIQFQRNRMIDFKSKVILLYKLLKETTAYAKSQLKRIEKLLSDLESDGIYMPLLATEAYPASKYIHEKVISDEYYHAFRNYLDNCIGSETLFFDLKYNAVFVDSQIIEIYRMHSEALIRDHDRRKNFVQMYNSIDTVLSELLSNNINSTDSTTQALLAQLNAIWTKNLISHVKLKPDGKGNIRDVYNSLVSPMFGVFQMVYPPAFHPLVKLLGDCYSIHNDIEKQNRTIAQEILSMIPSLKNSIESLDIVNKKLSEQPYNYYISS